MKFLPSRSEAEKLACSDKKIFDQHPCSKSTFLLYTEKNRLKNHVTAVHLQQCKTNFFIRLRF